MCWFPLGDRGNTTTKAQAARLDTKFIEVSDPRIPQISYESLAKDQLNAPDAFGDIDFLAGNTGAPTIPSTTAKNGSAALSVVINYKDTASVANTDQWQVIFPTGTQIGVNSSISVKSPDSGGATVCDTKRVFSSTNRAFAFPSIWAHTGCKNTDAGASTITINDITAPLGNSSTK
jgi:hypothetical protein